MKVRYIAFNNLLKNTYDKGDSTMFINENMSFVLLYKAPMIRTRMMSDGKCDYFGYKLSRIIVASWSLI